MDIAYRMIEDRRMLGGFRIHHSVLNHSVISKSANNYYE